MKRVGLTISLALLVSISMPVASEASYYEDGFRGSPAGWSECGGVVRSGEPGEWPEEHGHILDERSYMVLEDNDDTVVTEPATRAFLHTESEESYKAEAIMQRDPNYTTPDGQKNVGDEPIALLFGVTGCGGFGFYKVNIANSGASLWYIHNATHGFQLDTFSSDSPAFSEGLEIVEWAHRYGVTYDNTTRHVKVFIDGFQMYSESLDVLEAANAAALGGVELPSATGHMGIEAWDDQRIYVQKARFLTLDTTGPTAEITRPDAGKIYIADNGIDDPTDGSLGTIVVGSLTVDATLTDDILGLRFARLYIDGELQADHTHRYAGELSVDDRWTIDTSGLSLGGHTVTIQGADRDNNIGGSVSVEFFVLPTQGDLGSLRGLTGE